MQHEPNDQGTPKAWIKKAKSNLVHAKQPKMQEVFWEDLCFDAQQAAEKALKAVANRIASDWSIREPGIAPRPHSLI